MQKSYRYYCVKFSNTVKILKASSFSVLQYSSVARKPLQTSGRSGLANSVHLFSASKLAQRIPAFFPWGWLGMADEMDGAIQQAPQPIRHVMG
jgi:hypothetical protein